MPYDCRQCMWQGECGDWRWMNDILLLVCVPQFAVCPNFKDYRLWNPLLHEQYFEQCRDSVNVKTGDVGITSWSYFRVKLSFMFPLCLLKERKLKKRNGVTYSDSIVTCTILKMT